MKTVLYRDREFEFIEYQKDGLSNKVLHYVPSEGEFVVVLPYKKFFGKMSFLVQRTLVLGWDSHPDYCSISLPLKYQPEVSAVYAIKEACGVKVAQKHLFHLGVCAASKRADDTFYLYVVDISHYEDDFEVNDLHWVDEETVLKSNDTQLITTYARFKYMI